MVRHPQRTDKLMPKKDKMKEYADKCSHAKSTELNVGDKVLIKTTKTEKDVFTIQA